jgi:hypothetical protein
MTDTADIGRIEDPEQTQFDLKLSRTIDGMPADIKDRFKALKVLMDEVKVIDEEEETEYR